MFESIPDYGDLVLLMFLIQNNKNFSKETGFSKNDNNHSSLEFENILMEKHEEYLDSVKNEEESIIEKFFYNKTEKFFNIISEDVSYERSLILLLSLVEPNINKQSIFTDHEIDLIGKIAPETLHRQRNLK